ncbi:unnamed protein product [Staurois parvus]|uniref:Uncharacterized protein n=1 Tax=Staurois parvus TaxID=386267 RepID=A0ABN9BUC7_9NEOB|nr:unnamed protein product [Staurois parvus]
MPHISAHLSCLSVSPISSSQCRLSVPYMSAAFQCPSVPHTSASSSVPTSASSSVPTSATYQCPSLQPH